MPDDEKQSSSSPSETPTNWGSILGKIIGVAVRVMLAIVLGIAIGIAIDATLVYPTQIANKRIDSLSNRLNYAEESNNSVRSTQSSGLANVASDLAQQSAVMGQLESDIQAIQTAQPDAGRINQLSAGLATLQAEAEQSAGRLDALENAAATPDPQLEEIGRQVGVLRLMAAVSQAKLFLVQGDYGQASVALDGALALAKTQASADPADSQVADVQSRLVMAQQELQTRPLIAAGDLDIAWQILVELSRAP